MVFSGSNFVSSATHLVLAEFNNFVLNLETDNYGGETSQDPMNSSSDVVQSKDQYLYY